MKLCRVCNTEKSYDKFTPHKSTRDGFQNVCRECDKEYHRERFKNNPEHVRKMNYKGQRKWRVNNGIGVYGLWNKIDECYDYVGEGNLNDRENTHRLGIHKATPDEVKLNIWLDDFDNVYEFRVLWRCDSKQQCQDTEAEYITQLNPRYNIRKNKNKRQYEAE